MLDNFEDQNNIYIVLEFLSGGDLFDYMKKRNFSVPDEMSRTIISKIANAIYYMHRMSIVHRDIKLENVMMTRDSDINSEPKLIDFGLAKAMGPEEDIQEKFGTLGYCAPEILNRGKYDISVDLFSLGVMIFAMLSGHFPFAGQTEELTV
jgi:serine/threonine protein kinase